MQSVSSRIWTRVAVSIFYDDNHYTTGTSKFIIIIRKKYPTSRLICILYRLKYLIKSVNIGNKCHCCSRENYQFLLMWKTRKELNNNKLLLMIYIYHSSNYCFDNLLMNYYVSNLENEMHEILSDFEIQTDRLISARPPGLVIVKRKKKPSELSTLLKPRYNTSEN